MKRKYIIRFFVSLGIAAVLFLATFNLLSTSKDWDKFKNNTAFKYSFSYPANWFLIECGQGEVIVTKKKTNKCYYPLEADQEYLENVYLQTFVPKNNHSIMLSAIHNNEYSHISELKEWYESSWIMNDWPGIPFWIRYEANNAAVMVRSQSSSWYMLYSPQYKESYYGHRKEGKPAVAVPNFHFVVRYNNTNPEIQTIKKVLDTVRIN